MKKIKLQFIPGLQLSEIFYFQEVRPLLHTHFSKLTYSAGLVGEGSEVLGYDDEMSADHCWGPRIMLFLSEHDYKKKHEEIRNILLAELPEYFKGYMVRFDCPVKTTVDLFTSKSFFQEYIGFDGEKEMRQKDWLRISSQKLLEVVSGNFFHDGLNVEKARKQFSYYPKDVWLYILSCQWTKIAQEQAFLGRTGMVGDDVGSQLVCARMVRELMKLCFLLERKYIPYTKWFGTAFAHLTSSKKLTPIFKKAMTAKTWKEREMYLSRAYQIIGQMHNALRTTQLVSEKVHQYFNRPFIVIDADGFAHVSRKAIRSKEIKSIKTNAGALDQFVDSTDILSYPEMFERFDIWK